MKTTSKLLTACLLLSVAAIAPAQDSDAAFDIDAKFRSKIAKEKAKQAALKPRTSASTQEASADSSECGSQNIGNVNLNGRPGSQPREVFVFAPNAINLVGTGACR
jgi:hypothetical protein